MVATEAQKRAHINYAKKSLKRIPLDVKKEYYEELEAAALAAGESVRGYILRAVEERMQREAGQ